MRQVLGAVAVAVFCTSGLVAVVAEPAGAAVITVGTLVDEDETGSDCSLREAIKTAKIGTDTGGCTGGTSPGADTIQFDVTGTIQLTNGVLPFVAEPLIIDGPNPDDLVVDAFGANQILSTGAALTLRDLRLQDGVPSGANGGAVTVATGQSLSATNVVFSNNTANSGGAVEAVGTATVTVIDSAFTGNHATVGGGGGIFAGTGLVTVTNTDFSSNDAVGTGGAIDGSAVTVSGDSDFTMNTASGGGAIHAAGNATLGGGGIFEGNSALAGGAVLAPDQFVTVSDGTSFVDNEATGASGRGGCIDADDNGTIDVDPAVPGSQFTGNTATLDGGCLYGKVSVDAATFKGNRSEGGRGGAIAGTGTVTVVNTTFGGLQSPEENEADGGGAIWNGSGSTSVDNSTFLGNEALGGSGGGGILVEENATSLSVTDSTFTSNVATTNGGAIASPDSTQIVVERSTFAGNIATASGGAIYHATDQLSAAVVRNSTLYNNEANGSTGTGGAIIHVGGAMLVEYSTIAENSAGSSGAGGGLSRVSGSLDVVGSIVTGNVAPSGANCSGAINDAGDNLAWPSAGGCATFTVADPVLGSLQDNGGATETMQPLTGSAAVDAVTGTCPAIGVETDQRGVDRPVPLACDIGAVEVDYRPDNLIRKKAKDGFDDYVGGGLYNADGAGQTKTLKKKKGKKAVFKIRVESDDPLRDDDVRVTGTDGNKKFKVTYLLGDENVTEEVVGAGYLVALDPGAFVTLKVEVKVKKKAKKGNDREFLVTSTSDDFVGHLDAVMAVAERK